MRISQKVNGVIMRNIWHIIFIRGRRYHLIFVSVSVFVIKIINKQGKACYGFHTEVLNFMLSPSPGLSNDLSSAFNISNLLRILRLNHVVQDTNHTCSSIHSW